MKISFKLINFNIDGVVYRSKTYSDVVTDENGLVISETIKTRAKNKYDLFTVESLEIFASTYPNIYNYPEMWEIEPDVLPN